MPAGDEDTAIDERRLLGGAGSGHAAVQPAGEEVRSTIADRHLPISMQAGSEGEPKRQQLSRQMRESVQKALVLEWEKGTAFLFLPVLFAFGAILYFHLGNEPSAAVTVALVALAVSFVVGTRSRFLPKLMATALFAVALGFAAAKTETLLASTKMLGAKSRHG